MEKEIYAGNIENGAAHSNHWTPFTMLGSPPNVLMSLQKVEQYSMVDTFEGVRWRDFLMVDDAGTVHLFEILVGQDYGEY